MQDNKKFNPENISFLEFKVIKGQVNAPEEFNTDSVVGHHLETKFELSFNLELKQVKADLKLDIKTDSAKKNKKEASAKFDFIYIFKVKDLELYAKLNKEKLINVDSILASTLASLAYSTSRGILLTRLQGTALQNCIIPVVNPIKLLNNEI